MKQAELRTLDYLDWLKKQEAWVLFLLEYGESPAERIDLGEELQMIREIKDIVTKYEGVDDASTC